MIVVPAIPATTVAVTKVPNSRTIATTMKPPERSMPPSVARKLPACRPGPAEAPRGDRDRDRQRSRPRRMKMHWITNWRRQANGGRSGDAQASGRRAPPSRRASRSPRAGAAREPRRARPRPVRATRRARPAARGYGRVASPWLARGQPGFHGSAAVVERRDGLLERRAERVRVRAGPGAVGEEGARLTPRRPRTPGSGSAAGSCAFRNSKRCEPPSGASLRHGESSASANGAGRSRRSTICSGSIPSSSALGRARGPAM